MLDKYSDTRHTFTPSKQHVTTNAHKVRIHVYSVARTFFGEGGPHSARAGT